MNELERLVEAGASGGLSRREFVRRATALGISGSALVPLLAACGGSGDNGGGAAGEGGEGGGGGEALTLGFSLGTLAQRRWQFDREYVLAAAEEAGATVIVQAAEDDERTQISQVENMVSQGIDALILSPINVETAAPAATAAANAGIPVISYNSIVLNAPLDYWVARDNVEVGRMQAELAVKAKPEGNYVIVSGEPGVDIAQEKTRGAQEVLQPHIDAGDIRLVSQEYHRGWDPAAGLRQVENALSVANNRIDAIICNYDGFVLTAMEAVQQHGLLGETWLGGEDVFLEVAQAIVQGNAAMSSYTDLREMAEKAVAAALALVRGQEPESDDTIDNGAGEIPGSRISSFAVTRENMCEFLIDTNWLEPAEVYEGVPEDERPEACR